MAARDANNLIMDYGSVNKILATVTPLAYDQTRNRRWAKAVLIGSAAIDAAGNTMLLRMNRRPVRKTRHRLGTEQPIRKCFAADTYRKSVSGLEVDMPGLIQYSQAPNEAQGWSREGIDILFEPACERIVRSLLRG